MGDEIFQSKDVPYLAYSENGSNGQTKSQSDPESISRRHYSEESSNHLIHKSRTNSEKSLTLSYSSSYVGDYREAQSPHPKERPNFGPKLPVTMCILFTELCERLVYYGVAGNLLVFLKNNLNVDSALASSIVLVFTGVSFVVPLFGGWIADSFAGKYNTLFGSILIYLVGTCLLPAVAFKYSEKLGDQYTFSHVAQCVFFGVSLLFISLGTGGIKANVSPFGAEQVQSLGPQAISIFFNWFYWFINVGSFISYTGIVYIQTEKSFFVGYLILCGAIFLATILLVSGRKKYICKPPNGSVIMDLCKIMHKAIQRKWRVSRSSSSKKDPDLRWLDYARVRFGGPYLNGQVDTVFALLKILPVFATMILYWTVYFQMQTSFLLQGLHMNLAITKNFNIPAASLSLFDIVIILLLIPFMDRVVYPLFAKWKIKLSSLRRMGIGMIFAILSVVVAAIIEVQRKKHLKDGKTMTTKGGKTYNQSSITVFYQVPQFVLIGISEVFTSISGLEFAYAQSPRVLQGVVMGLFLLTSGLGSFLGSALIQIVKAASMKAEGVNWYNDDINKGSMESFFYLLAILLGVNFLVFCAISVRYTYVSEYVLKKNEDDWSKQDNDRMTPCVDEDIGGSEYTDS